MLSPLSLSPPPPTHSQLIGSQFSVVPPPSLYNSLVSTDPLRFPIKPPSNSPSPPPIIEKTGVQG